MIFKSTQILNLKKNDSTKDTIQVIIYGGGPMGLLTACKLIKLANVYDKYIIMVVSNNKNKNNKNNNKKIIINQRKYN